MTIDASDRFTARQAAVRSTRALAALKFLIDKNPSLREPMLKLVDNEVAARAKR